MNKEYKPEVRYKGYKEVILEITPDYAIEFTLSLTGNAYKYEYDIEHNQIIDLAADSAVELYKLDYPTQEFLIIESAERINAYISNYDADILVDLADDDLLNQLDKLNKQDNGAA